MAERDINKKRKHTQFSNTLYERLSEEPRGKEEIEKFYKSVKKGNAFYDPKKSKGVS